MKYLIYGSRTFALVLRDFLHAHDMEFCGFIDDFRTGEAIVGRFAKVVERYSPSEYQVVLGIGYNNLPVRLNASVRVREAGFTLATLIHRRAYTRDAANIREGAIVMANAVIDCNAIVCEAAVLWPNVVVNHDSKIGRNSFVSPSATICGCVNVGENCFIGAGAVVVDHVDVPDGTFVKANSLYKGTESVVVRAGLPNATSHDRV